MIKAEPGLSRRELSRRICQRNGWYSPNGNLKDMSCRKALVELDRQGIIHLPAVEKVTNFTEFTPTERETDVSPSVSCTLAELGEVRVKPISSRYTNESKVWRTLLEKYHYLGAGPLCGAQIRYIVESNNYGYIGALAFTSATWALKSRDDYIGWSKRARRANLGKIVTNSRFLLVPELKVANLASHVLSLALSRLAQDWEERYRVSPVLAETFVDPTLFSGTCYRAANWQYIGKTAGRRDGRQKNIFIYPLHSHWQEILCQEPEVKWGEMPRLEEPANWAEEEFSTVRWYDPRLKRRLYTIAQDFFANCEKNIPEACGCKAKTMGAYRFFSHQEVSMKVILDAHLETTLERVKKQQIVLAPQDTTILDYSTHPLTTGLGPTNGVEQHSIGLILHDTLAFTEDGTPLGILDAQCWARDPQKRGKSRHRKELPLEQKESAKWLHSFSQVAALQKLCPDTTLVSIGDRESDIFELFLAATREPAGPKLLVRAEKTRNRKVEQQHLWEYMAAREMAGALKIHIPRRGSNKARDTWVEIRFAEVTLSPPKKSSFSTPVKVWAVYVTEKEIEEGIKPVEWMLLTTAPVETFADAQKRVEWYSSRWGIEVYHRTLKSGCRIKDRQLGTADRLEACLGVDMVVAWRIYHLTMLGREIPDLPCTVFFNDVEWKALCVYVNKNPILPPQPPSLKEAICMVAGMGGYLGRKSDGPPGTQTMWRGLQRLETAAEMYGILTGQGPSPPI
ncbi:MAG: IS4 family transposase [Atribacterales bacterium]